MIRSAKAQHHAKTRVGAHADDPTTLEAALTLMEELAVSPPEVGALLSLVVTRAQELTGAPGATFVMRDQSHVIYRAAVGSAAPLAGRRERLESSFVADTLLTGKPTVCGDICADSRFDSAHFDTDQLAGLGLRSVVLVPVKSSHTNIGSLVITSPQVNAFGDEHLRLLRVVGRILSWRLDQVEKLQKYHLLLTENDIALATLRESENRFRGAFDHSGIGMALMASDGRWLKVNPALCRTLGYSRRELLALDHRSTTHPDDRGLEEPLVRQILAGEIGSYQLEKRYLHKNDSVIWGLLTVSVVKTPGQQALYLIVQIQDITERKANEETLKRLAVRDELTGLCNRREMFRVLKEESSRAQRHRRPLSLIMLDIDAFKTINDTYGHQAGDASLAQIADIITESVRSFDRVARYGGEEFAVILPETSDLDALIVAERIRTRVADETLSVSDQTGAPVRIPMTISAGVATVTAEQAMSVENLIRAADANLYAAKEGGRNRCVAAASGFGSGKCEEEQADVSSRELLS